MMLGVPVRNRFDLLNRLIHSAMHGYVRPHTIVVINNSDYHNRMVRSFLDASAPIVVLEGDGGVASAWNLLLSVTDDQRVIANDDVVLAPHSLEVMVQTPGDFVTALAGSHAFSCFAIRNTCVDRVGRFDEGISPGYAYWEDLDYALRMQDAGVLVTAVECGVQHEPSQTKAIFTESELSEHHRRFMIAKANFTFKHGDRRP